MCNKRKKMEINTGRTLGQLYSLSPSSLMKSIIMADPTASLALALLEVILAA
jgi:hypothetical protein